MATKSILKSINIKDKQTATDFVRALERASRENAKNVVPSQAFSDASREEIREMFKMDK
ncbi:MAG: hypothetical protein LUD84_10975 [Clostridiales bacterium]|nr:hypothetical protein [Clostridiales bacterium]